MLAKVPVKRIDGKSSFVALTSYILTHAAAVRHSEGVYSAESAGIEMDRVARRNERVKDAAYHYVLSWQSGENPTDSQAFDAVTATLTALNLADHQWIGAIHRNTQHVHTHVAVNRVNPESYKSVYPKGDWLALDQACRELELRHGWSHTAGPFVVEVGAGSAARVVRARRDNAEVAKPAPTTKARDFAAWNGVDSFQEWVGKAPADSLKRELEKPDASWRNVHESLKLFNLEYRTKASGAVVVDCSAPERLCAKASHLGRFASFGQLVARLGTYEHPKDSSMQQHNPKREQAVEPATSYRGAAEKREQPRDQSRTKRSALFERYSTEKLRREATKYQRAKQVWSRQKASEQTRIEGLRDENRAARKRVKSLPSHHNKRAMYSVQAFVVAAKREILQRTFQEERRAIRVMLKSRGVGTWREWLSREASAGDALAVEVLRRISYRDQAERRLHDPLIELGTVSGADEPSKTLLSGVNWIADARGVDYRVHNVTMFRDEGRRVVFRDIGDDAIRAGLALCREKWAYGLCLSGKDEFRTRVRAMAATMHIRIAEPSVNQPALDLDAARTRDLNIRSSDSSGFSPGLERLLGSHGKPVVIAELRIGRRHTGKIIAAESLIGDIGTIVIDIGRELAVVRTDSKTAISYRSQVGGWIRAQATPGKETPGTYLWRLGDPQSFERMLGRWS